MCSFMTHLNNNQWEIRFIYECSSVSVNFLDLMIFKEQNLLLTKTFLKTHTETDKELQVVSLLDRTNLLVPKQNRGKVRKDLEWSFLTTF